MARAWTRLEEEYLQATEWNLATLGELVERKSSSKARVDRQKLIVVKMLLVCRDISKDSGNDIPTRFSRVKRLCEPGHDLLQDIWLRQGMPGLVDAYIGYVRGVGGPAVNPILHSHIRQEFSSQGTPTSV